VDLQCLSASKSVWTVFLLQWNTFFLLSTRDLGAAGQRFSGILTGAAAMYTSFAEVTNGAFSCNIIPLGTPFIQRSPGPDTEWSGYSGCVARSGIRELSGGNNQGHDRVS
jgi:hypothetical protein